MSGQGPEVLQPCYQMQTSVDSSQVLRVGWCPACPHCTTQQGLGPRQQTQPARIGVKKTGTLSHKAACSAYLTSRCSSAAASPCALLRPQQAPAQA